MSPKQQAFEDMRREGVDTSVFNFEFLLCGFRFDGRMTNGGKRAGKARVQKYTKQVKPFNLLECTGGFVVRLD